MSSHHLSALSPCSQSAMWWLRAWRVTSPPLQSRASWAPGSVLAAKVRIVGPAQRRAQALFLPTCKSGVVAGDRWPPGLRQAGHTCWLGLCIPGLRGELGPGTRPYWKCLTSPTQWRAGRRPHGWPEPPGVPSCRLPLFLALKALWGKPALLGGVFPVPMGCT